MDDREIVHQPICGVLILVLEICAQPSNTDAQVNLHAINNGLQWLTEMQPGEGKDYVSKTCEAVRMLLDICSARQRTQSQGAQAQVPLTPNLSVRATGPSITSGIDDPGTLGHDDMTYLASDGFGDSMVIAILSCNGL